MTSTSKVEHHLLLDPAADLRAYCGVAPGRASGGWRWHSAHNTATFVRCFELELRCCSRCLEAAFDGRDTSVTGDSSQTSPPKDSGNSAARAAAAQLSGPRDQVTDATVLGSLVDRAVSMPYALPQVLRKGHRRDYASGSWTTSASISEDIGAAARLIRDLMASLATSSVSKMSPLIDPAGPWWPTTSAAFHQLPPADRDSVIDRIVPASLRIAEQLEARASEEKWSWLWSQPNFAKPGSMLPAMTRPDLVAGLDWKRCIIIDVKTTRQRNLRSALRHKAMREAFSTWSRALEQLKFRPTACEALVASTVSDYCQWVDFSSQCLVPTDEPTEPGS